MLHTCNGHSQRWVYVVQFLNSDTIAIWPLGYFLNGVQSGFEPNEVVISVSDINDYSAVRGAAILQAGGRDQAVGLATVIWYCKKHLVP